VKRFLIAAGLALAIHGYFLGTDPVWLNKKPVRTSKTRVFTMTLAHRQSARPKPEPVVKRPEVKVRKAPAVVKKKKSKSVRKPVKPKKAPVLVAPAKSPQSHKKVTVLRQEPSHIPVSEPALPPEPKLADISRDAALDFPELKEEVLEEEIPQTEDGVKPSSPLQVAHTVQLARPLYQKNPSPEYPRLAKRRGYEGTVVLEVLVDEEGRVEDMRLFRSSKHRILDRAAMASVREWLFKPGMRGQEPVEMWVKIPIRFQLK
jgi:protein TonB